MPGRASPQPALSRLRAYERTARRSAARNGLRPWAALGRIDPRGVFVVGCPRSGTTLVATAIGEVSGFADLGEVNRLKGAVPGLYASAAHGGHDAVVREVRGIVRLSQRAAMVVGRRAVEQTPECSYLIPQLAEAFPQARFVHVIRDGRDVAASLLEKGWLGDGDRPLPAEAPGSLDDAGLPLGGYARFWVEPGREEEFVRASEATRCGWAWRRYVGTALDSLARLAPDRVITIRYEDLVARSAEVAGRVAIELDCAGRADELVTSFSRAHARSVGRFTTTLSPGQLPDVMAQIDKTLSELGYLR